MNIRQILLSVFLCITVLKVPGAAEPQGMDSLPAVACHFESSVKHQGQDLLDQNAGWYFWREPGRIETRVTTGETSEIWQQGQQGNISYQLILHESHLVFDSTSDQLRAIRDVPEWAELASLFPSDLLKVQLQETGTVEVLGRRAKRYQGKINDVTVEVWWLETERIPALVRQVYPESEETLRLAAIYPVDQSPWPRSQIAHYAHLNLADFEDAEPTSRVFDTGDAVMSYVRP